MEVGISASQTLWVQCDSYSQNNKILSHGRNTLVGRDYSKTTNDALMEFLIMRLSVDSCNILKIPGRHPGRDVSCK